MIKPIPVNEPALDGKEKDYLIDCIDTGWISSEGPFIKQFEENFAERVQRKFGIAVCNGSAALDAAVAALQFEPGDEIILPAFTIISCASSIVRAGCKPVLVDCDPVTWNMDATQIEDKITNRTKAIMVVHIYGLPVDMDPVYAIAERHGLFIIEDAAEAHGQTYRNQPCGGLGTISTFSFYPNKHITTGEGGMVLTDDPNLAERCRSLRNLCFQPQRRFVHEELGWNFRMSNLQAALGVAQLERLDQFVERKRNMGRFYTRRLKDLRGIQLPLEKTPYAENIYWVYGIVLEESLSISAADVIEQLRSKQIGTRPFFWPMHEQPVFLKMGLFTEDHYPVAERIARKGFYLPSGLGLTEKDIERVCSALKEVLT